MRSIATRTNSSWIRLASLALIAALPLPAGAQSDVGGDAASMVRGAASPSSSMMQPISQLTLPVEAASLSSHVGLQFGYSRLDLALGPDGTGINVIAMAIEAQYVLLDRFEIGLNVPFLTHGWVSGLGQRGGDETAFGNLQLNLKAKLYEASALPLAVAVYANTTLPTTSVELGERAFVFLHTGAAATAKLNAATFGAATGVFALIDGTTNGSNKVLYTLDFFGGVRLHPLVALQVAMQLGVPIEPSGGELAYSVTPAVQVFPLENLHVDIGSRIAVTEGGRGYTGGGRASLVAAAGYNF